MKIKKFALLSTIVAGSLLLGACGGGDSNGDDAEDTVEVGDDHSFIYVTNDPIGVNEFLESGKVGIEQAAEEFNGTSKIYESDGTDESRRSNLDAAVAEAPDVVVMITFDFTDLSAEYAEANPDQEFLLIDDCPADAPDNLTCAVFREHEASYLIGVEAGLRTESDHIGTVASVDNPLLQRYYEGFREGAESVNSDVESTELFIEGENPFSDPAKGKEQALSMAATGADNVFAVGAGSNGGIFEAAEEEDFTAYGVDVDQCDMAPGHGGDGTLKAVDVLVVSEIEKILDGEADSVSSYGLAEGGMDIVALADDMDDSECTIFDEPDIIEELEDVKQQIIDGDIEVTDPAES